MDWFATLARAFWEIWLDAALYVLFGLVMAGLVRAWVNPASVARHLGRGRFWPVVKAALWGVPLPLCSCGVLPAAAGLRKQGANAGATTAFLIATPESGVDSMAITYALMDPVMTVARPLAAMLTALAAGVAVNLTQKPAAALPMAPDLSCPLDGCCDGHDCPPQVHRHHHTAGQRLGFGLRYAITDLWVDLAPWFVAGVLLAALMEAVMPPDLLGRHLGNGLGSMLAMLAIGVPLYICATASTPIAAALMASGLGPGAALVFLLAGPATNLAGLTVLYGVLGRRATAVYLASIMVGALAAGQAVQGVYDHWGLDARAMLGGAGELAPAWLRWAAALGLAGLSAGPLARSLAARWRRWFGHDGSNHTCTGSSCGCS